MKIAFLMQCHKNPEQINLLLKALKSPDVDIFIHVDSKSERIEEDIQKGDGIYLLPNKECIDVQWAQFSQVKATLHLLNAAISRGGYSHYFLISGQDFPLKPIEEIVNFLRAHEDDNFIDCSSIKKFEKRNEIYFPSCVVGRKLWQKIIKNLWIYGTGGWDYTFSLFKRHPVDDFSYYFGSQWWCLNGKTIKWIHDYLTKQPEYIKLFSHSLCPDECFFQTLVMNSPYADNVKSYLHYIKWEKGKSSPEILTQKDYEECYTSGKLMARKFDIDIDRKIIDRLNS